MIQIDKLKFSYGPKTVLENISMQLEPGKIYGLLGENGVGKTTLLTLICGLKKPQSGSISIDGQKPFDREPDFLGNQFFLPDHVREINDSAIHWAKTNGIFWPNYQESTFVELMKLFETDPAVKMNRMSAGMLKKTHISFALACAPRYLYLDEPTNALDIPGKTQFRTALLKYTPEESTIIISTHQVKDLENIIDPIIILDKQDVLLNADIETISSKLFFDYSYELKKESLYTEQHPGGYVQVYLNNDGQDSKVNIEALFNTVHKHKDIIKNLFK